MADKSPRQQMTQKSGKSLKEKRAQKHAKQAEAESTVPMTRKAKGGGH